MNSRPTMNSPAPTKARMIVLWFAVSLAIITYVDRVCISQAAPAMQADLGLTKMEMGYAFTAFGWAYALFEIPGGWLGDKIGPRKVLMRVVAMWSVFTIATGWAWNLLSLVVCRFLFGVGEAGCFPNLTKAFTLWFPAHERVKAQGIMWLSARWGGAFTPLLVGWMLAGGSGQAGLGLHYKWVFLIFGGLGVVWAVLFYNWFRDHPHDHPSVNAAELEEIGETDRVGGGHAMPWGKLVSSRTVWMLWFQYFFMSYAWYFYITWFPTYLKEQFTELTEMQRALLACVPLFFGGLGCFASGHIAGPLERRFGGRARSRRVVGIVGFGAAAVMMYVSTQLSMPVLSVCAVGLASFASDLTLPCSWGACMEVGGRYTGALAGSMNMVGNAGGAIAPMVVPIVLSLTGNNWTANMLLFAAAYLAGAICWAFIDSDERLQSDAVHESTSTA
ncbi:MAG: MFS transporter [Planctomycetes bacterium]|nr:MFS transporter [Planctomycetota bacterium]